VIDPVEYVDTHPESLRDDFKTDYVLMVAETYQVDRDIQMAVERLEFLGNSKPETIIENAMYFAVQSDYAVADLGLLRLLSDAVMAETDDKGTSQP
jgi:hypothetical protein